MLLENITNIRWAEAVHAARPIRVGQVSSVSASGFTAAGLAAAVATSSKSKQMEPPSSDGSLD